MKVVLDTNVLISAFLSDGVCSRILRRARNREFAFVLCMPVMEEFSRILKDKFRFDNAEITFFTSIVSEAAHETSRPEKPVPCICRDANDDHVLACAAEAKADFLVTGDDDLLTLVSYGKTKIIRPRDFELLFGD
jgi:putative PIN family toxin of toxin-antitoxin system